MKHFQGVILAAGVSKRMGTPKWRMKIGGRTFLDWIVDAMTEAGIEKIFVVLNEPYPHPAKFLPLINPHPENGQLSSLKIALEVINPRLPFMMQLVDRPLVKWETYLDLMRVNDGDITIPCYGKRNGHPVVFPPKMRRILLDTGNELGIRGAMMKWPGFTEFLVVRDEAILWNIDTPEDLKLYKNKIKD
jgi:molybdenum cofactor cytidylyltransferase